MQLQTIWFSTQPSTPIQNHLLKLKCLDLKVDLLKYELWYKDYVYDISYLRIFSSNFFAHSIACN